MLYQAQGLPFFPLKNAYKKEKKISEKTVEMIPISTVPTSADVVTSHVLYKVKTNDYKFLKLKARPVPQGSKDSEKLPVKTDSAVRSPTGIRNLLSLATIFKWCLAKINFKGAFCRLEMT